jgi:diguanylate cyclase (GGDEF)-like protein
MPLYLPTLAVVSILVTAVLGLLLLFAWVQDRSIRALAWWGAAYLVGGFAVALISITDSLPNPLANTLANGVLFLACGLSWNGARLFDGRSVRPFAMFAGVVLWLLLFRIPGFEESITARVIASTTIVSGYTLLAAFEIWHGTSERLVSRWPAVGVLMLHALFFASQIPLIWWDPAERTSSSFVSGWFAILALETLLYVIATAFIVLAMAKERSDRFYKTVASTDVLTGVANRRALLETGRRIIRRHGRQDELVAVLMCDIDHFKSINDRFGHFIGDQVIKLFADTATASLRSTDLVGRFGGEEFAAILPNSDLEDAIQVAERVRAAFETAATKIGGHPVRATVSIGVAVAGEEAPSIEALLTRADGALYQAKRNGRNRVEVARGDSTIIPPEVAAREATGIPAPVPATALIQS